jgi:hypothetical protein
MMAFNISSMAFSLTDDLPGNLNAPIELAADWKMAELHNQGA